MNKLKFYLVLVSAFIFNGLFSQNDNTIQFSSVPFSKEVNSVSHFVWGKPIYGKITMTKSLKNYAKKLDNYDMMNVVDKEKYSSALTFMVCPKTEDINDRTTQEIKLVVSQQDLEAKTIAFDLMPSEENASSIFITGFYAELANSKLIKYNPSEGTSSGEKIEFDVYLSEKEVGYGEEEVTGNGRLKLVNQIYLHLGKLTIDYSSVSDVREVMEWHDRSRTIKENVAEKYKKK